MYYTHYEMGRVCVYIIHTMNNDHQHDSMYRYRSSQIRHHWNIYGYSDIMHRINSDSTEVTHSNTTSLLIADSTSECISNVNSHSHVCTNFSINATGFWVIVSCCLQTVTYTDVVTTSPISACVGLSVCWLSKGKRKGSVGFQSLSQFLAVSLQSTRPAVAPATLKMAATNFAAWWTEAQWCEQFA